MRSAIPIPIPIFCLLAAACGPGRPIHYYTITPPALPAVPAKPDGLVLLVGLIATPDALQDGRIRYRSGANETGAYEYHRWTERPGMMARELLLYTLRSSGNYRQVRESASTAGGDYLVHGRLEEFCEVDGPALRTRVSLRLELVERKTGRMVWEKQFQREEPVSGKDMKDVVRSLDHNLQQAVTDAAGGIASFLAGRG